MILTEEKWQQYIDGQCTDEERKQLSVYLQTLTPSELRALIPEPGQIKIQAMPDESASRMDAFVAELMNEQMLHKKRPDRLYYYWAAACVAAIAIGLWLFTDIVSRPADHLATNKKYDSIYNAGPHLKLIILPDSSNIWLTPKSLLQVANGYAKYSREVLLEGEAYFEIHSNPKLPFIAISNKLSTRVLGTHFNIESYKGESETRITLTEGKVAVQLLHEHADSSRILTPGKRLLYRNDQGTVITENSTGISESDWKNGAIVLKDLQAVEVFHRLECRFGKKFLYDPSLFAGKRFTATYQRSDLGTILKNMAFIYGFEFSIKDNEVQIHPSK